MKRLLIPAVLILLSQPRVPAAPPERPSAIVYTTARLAETEPCACKANRGGLGRQAHYLEKLRARANVVLLEAGDTFFRNYRINPSEAPMLVQRARTVVDALARQQLAATAVGDCDLAVGLPVLLELAAAAPFPVLCANLATADGARPFRSHVMLESAGTRLAVIGLLSADLAMRKLHPELRVESPKRRLRSILKSLSPRPDRIVLLAHMPPAEAADLLKVVKGIDLAILGHADGRLEKAEQCGAALLVGSESRGRELGEVSLPAAGSIEPRMHRHVLVDVKLAGKDEVTRLVAPRNPFPPAHGAGGRSLARPGMPPVAPSSR